MPSEFDILAAEFCSPVLVEQFGERDAQGDLAKIVYRENTGEPRELVGCILHNLRVNDEIEDVHGTHTRDEIEQVLEIEVPRVQSWGVFDPKPEAKIEVPNLPGTVFTIQEVTSLSSTWAHIRTKRGKVTGIRRTGAYREQDR